MSFRFRLYYKESSSTYLKGFDAERLTSFVVMLGSVIVYSATRRCRYIISRISVGSLMRWDSCLVLTLVAIDTRSEELFMTLNYEIGVS